MCVTHHTTLCSGERHTSAHPDLLGLPLLGQSALHGKERKTSIKVQFKMDIQLQVVESTPVSLCGPQFHSCLCS